MKSYRAEIDGLRAIAITLVILFHLTLSRLSSGGYIGVDVFFVISGYLITGHLRADLSRNFIGIFEFYRRRVIRIFPALFATYLACALCELTFKFPSQMTSFQNLLMSSVYFGSNFYLFSTTGYFDFRARANPLIHTWSLSIEEQFYIFLPLLLFFFRNSKPARQVGWLALLAGISLVASQYFLSVDPRISFYLVPLRAWELLAGSLLSYRATGPFTSRRWVAEGVGIAGLLMILASAYRLGPESAFPGFAALPAVLGTVILLVATDSQTTWVQRGLASPPMRFLGKISYSLYLWHWPLIVYSRYVAPIESTAHKIGLIAISVVAATLSWWLIEQPIRKRSRTISRGLALGVAGGAMVAATLLALALPRLSAMIWKANPAADQILVRMQTLPMHQTWRIGTCFIEPERIGHATFAPECLQLDPHRRNVLLLGDSHGAMLWWGLQKKFTDTNVMQATAGSCDPLNHYHSRNCAELMNTVIDGFLKTHKIDAVVVSLFWKDGDEKRIKPLLDRLKQNVATVVVFGPNRWFVLPFPEVAARAMYSGRQDDLQKYQQTGVDSLDRSLKQAVLAAGGRYVSIYDAMCPSRCWILGPGNLAVTYDYDHLSLAGSEMLAATLPESIFAPIAPSTSTAPSTTSRPEHKVFAPQPGVAVR